MTINNKTKILPENLQGLPTMYYKIVLNIYKHFYMKMKYLIFLLAATVLSCSDPVGQDVSTNSGDLIARSTTSKTSNAFDALKNGTLSSDRFTMDSLTISGRDILIQVRYGGGCTTHSFEMVWPEVILGIYPPQVAVILLHDDHGDLCEAFMPGTLKYSFDDSPIPFSDESISEMKFTVINGSNPDQSLSNR